MQQDHPPEVEQKSVNLIEEEIMRPKRWWSWSSSLMTLGKVFITNTWFKMFLGKIVSFQTQLITILPKLRQYNTSIRKSIIFREPISHFACIFKTWLET